ncbi:17-beta-hydroxysteroid dehydrogenase 14-like isoform X1 [Mya arenaria]|uniref:17-beta-hydroxysteroid dehydrogenase 14-like isoform X1 n=1 Tax=Mya arenaria TaxID=6604 RepID=UPI0022E66F57|nr:17-beta-hydroxysteroid dehydrogenase 14-like isoform X1 [Mya arenaria]
MASDLRFKEKIAIVTGGCQGIGKGCSEILAENGGTVVVFDINDKLGEDINETSFKGPGEIVFIHCDVTDEILVKSCIDKVMKKYGQIDCIVNNVGESKFGHTFKLSKTMKTTRKRLVTNKVTGTPLRAAGMSTIEGISVQEFRNLLEINLVSHFTMYKYGLPHLRKTKGSVVNIGSFSGTHGQGACPIYCATKGAIPALARAIAIDEAKHGVRVNTICPGPIQTPMTDALLASSEDSGLEDHVKSWTLMNRIGDPREIGKACLFLAADATFTTGTELMCTGGGEIGYGVKP